MGVIVGIDGGGSKTVVTVAEPDGTVIQTTTIGPTNPYLIGLDAAGATLTSVIAAALAAAERVPRDVDAIAIGLAGVDSEVASGALRDLLGGSYPGAICRIVNDADLVLAAGTPLGVGVAIIAGTGSIAIGRDPDGHEARTGGWGRVLGDDGSGYQVGLAGLRAAARALEGRGEGTVLVDRLRDEQGLRSVAELIQWSRNAAPAEIAALATLVVRACGDDDPVALRILEQSADALADLGRGVVRQLRWSEEVPLALAGGLLNDWPPLRERVVDALRTEGPGLGDVRTVREPVTGALLLARRARIDRPAIR